MDTLGYFTQELVLQHFKNLKLDMGGMNLVVHAMLWWLLGSHLQDVIYVYKCCLAII